MHLTNNLKITFSIFLVMALSACATQVVEQPSEITRATTPLGEFNKVILVKAEMKPEYAEHPANIKAVNKIDEVLMTNLSMVLDNIAVMSTEEFAKQDFTGTSDSEVLIVKPLVKQIKFIGGAARFWAGAMAGSSVVVMDTAFIDAGTGTQLSNPGFYRKAGAYADGFGIGSNRMLSDVAMDVVNYVKTNK